ncbi:hypothetical protein ELQ87_22345 [Streptomyces griseoviridis]|uniref:CGNR zinc finger domain-containing protein n=1 Tax=Streptomyces griseoviridis TaxID=45398 RepID=A0A3Q9KV54_STRGD|nr:hypothetical protein ELQ87_22345 [Streptomyces griseoviridis]QCN86446.1 hypothetical protein DDJ31_16920 [Streptomyces griseoviridis]
MSAVCEATWVVGVDRRPNAVHCSRRCVTRAWRAREGFVRRTVTVTVARTPPDLTADQKQSSPVNRRDRRILSPTLGFERRAASRHGQRPCPAHGLR